MKVEFGTQIDNFSFTFHLPSAFLTTDLIHFGLHKFGIFVGSNKITCFPTQRNESNV